MRLNSKHKVVNVVDGDTFDVVPEWDCFGEIGSRVRIANFDAPELSESGLRGAAAQWYKTLLNRMTYSKEIKIVEAHSIDRGRLVCDVDLDGHDLASVLREEAKTQPL